MTFQIPFAYILTGHWVQCCQHQIFHNRRPVRPILRDYPELAVITWSIAILCSKKKKSAASLAGVFEAPYELRGPYANIRCSAINFGWFWYIVFCKKTTIISGWRRGWFMRHFACIPYTLYCAYCILFYICAEIYRRFSCSCMLLFFRSDDFEETAALFFFWF